MTFGHTSISRIEHIVVFKHCLYDRVIFRFQIDRIDRIMSALDTFCPLGYLVIPSYQR